MRQQHGLPAGERAMTASLSALAKAAGLAEHWTDARQQARTVAPDTLRALLRAMDLPADSDAEIRASHARLAGAGDAGLPVMLVGTAGGALQLPPSCAGRYEISGAHARPLAGETTPDASGRPEIALPPVPGYYTWPCPRAPSCWRWRRPARRRPPSCWANPGRAPGPGGAGLQPAPRERRSGPRHPWLW
ncbi:hypothetical protein WJ972_13675 [Achromobacter insuavis]